jgi:hypothetical protein
MAIDKAGWKSNSSKHIILIGDASAHLNGKKNTTGLTIAQVIEKGRKSAAAASEQARGTINFHALRVIGEDPSDYPECEKQFQEVARNNGEFQGMYLVVDAQKPDDRRRVIGELTGMLTEAFQKLDLIATKPGAAAQALRDTPTNNPVVKSLYRILKTTGTGGSQPLRTGFASALSAGGNEVAKVRVLVEKDEVDRLRSTMDFLYTQFKGKADPAKRKGVKDLLQTLKQIASGTTAGQVVLKEDTELETLITSLPLKTRALKTSAQALAVMEVKDFQSWLDDLKKSKEMVEIILAKTDWVDISDGKIKENYQFVRKTDLP